MLLKMKRVQVIGPKKELNRVADLLYNEGSLHLESVTESVSSDEIPLEKVKLERAGEISDILGKIDGIFVTLPQVNDDPDLQGNLRESLQQKTHDQIIERAKEVIKELESTTRELASRKSELTLTVTSLNRYAKVLNIIQPVERELPTLAGFEVTILLIQKEYREVLELIKKELENITSNQFEMTSTTVDADTLAAIMVFNKKYSGQIHSFIYSVNVNEVRLPKEYMGRPFYEMYAMIEESKVAAENEIHQINDRLSRLAVTWYQELVVLRAFIKNINNEIVAFSSFGVSEYTFVIMGWIPKKLLKHARNSVKKAFGDRVVINELSTSWKDMEMSPTCYNNPRWVKPFEFIMQLISPPHSREIDPSPILAIFFPFFFGIMVGDIGYGLVILTVALLIKHRMKALKWATDMADILIISSIPTIFFGFIFGEFFGDFGEVMGWLHPVTLFGITWNRVEAMIPMLILAIAIGIVHIFLGLIMGIANAYTMKSKKHLSEKAGMLLMLIGLIILVLMLAEVVPQNAIYPTIVMIIVALPLILYGAGVFGTIEIMSTVGNILSYARLMAIGMASVILAMVANRLGVAFEIVIIGIIVAILLHALNIALAMFSPSIHSVRLHLVECFSKFYEGGGKEYRPFGRASEERIASP
jgi:V/A-type H+/Na+-transporting ATPase subunit I